MKERQKGRIPRPIRRTGTEVHEDVRTARHRSRSDERRYAIDKELEEWGIATDEATDEGPEAWGLP
jgi:hypothetical protein